jgi:hypothetical protein
MTMEKYGDIYLDISHAREIEFKNEKEPLAKIVWSDGKWEVFQGETAKSLYLSLNPEDATGPDTITTIFLTLALDAKENKWFVGADDGIVKITEHLLIETEDVLHSAVQILKPYLKRQQNIEAE